MILFEIILVFLYHLPVAFLNAAVLKGAFMRRAPILMGIMTGALALLSCNENVAYYCEVDASKPDCFDGYVCLEETVYNPSSSVGGPTSTEPLKAGNQRIGVCRKPCTPKNAKNECSYGFVCKEDSKGVGDTYCYEDDGNTDQKT